MKPTSNLPLLIAFIAVCFVQAAVPLSLIGRREFVLRQGRVYKFRTAPVDPVDAFRGRFVVLRVDQNKVSASKAGEYTRNQPVYVGLDIDADGFAVARDVQPSRPDGDDGYVKARVSHYPRDGLYIRWPFDRYYLNERAAPRAEGLYREHSRRGARDAYITVRAHGGLAVLEELYVGGQPIGEALTAP